MAAASRLNKDLWTNITKLKLLNTVDAPVRFILEQSPFSDDDDNDEPTSERAELTIIGRILPNVAIFNQSAFQIELKLPITYPTDPPEIRFLTPIYHPNVDKDGKFCHALLLKTVRWKPTMTLVEVLKAVVDRIDNPDIDYATNHDIGREYTDNRTEFNRKALMMINENKLPRH